MDLFAERLTDDTEVGAFLLSSNCDTSPSGETITLCIAGALHALILSGKDVALQMQYPSSEGSDTTLWPAVVDAFLVHRDFILG